MTSGSTNSDVSELFSSLARFAHYRGLKRLVPLLLLLFAGLILLAVDVFPIVTNDSLKYIQHSNALAATGLVQVGYRQFGYPLFLAFVDSFASFVHMEPLLAAVLLQRIIYLSAVFFGVWMWRWRAIPLALLSIVPSLVVYTNLVLTEGLALGLAAWYAVLVALAIRIGGTDSEEAQVRSSGILIAIGTLVTAIYVLLAVTRFQYVLLGFGVAGVWYLMYRTGGSIRKAAIALSIGSMLLLSLLFASVAAENDRELGIYSPSARGERSRFWAAWQVTFELNPQNQAEDSLLELFADGNPYAVMRRIDAIPGYTDQQDAYVVAMDQLIAGSQTSWLAQRIDSAAGVLRGGRIDDVRHIAWAASRADFDSIENSMYRARPIREQGVEYFIAEFNEGRHIQPLILSPLAPLRGFPYFLPILRWALAISLGLLTLGVFSRHSRLLASIGLLTLLSTAGVFGYLLMDNVRFILVPLIFVVFTATGVGDSLWRAWQGRFAGDAHA